MYPILPSDWGLVFLPETPLLELVGRGSAIYLGVLALLRLMPRRAGGELGRMDLIFLLLIAEAVTHGLGDYSSVGDALIVIATLMVWDYLINLLSFRIAWIERLVSSPPVEVVRNGRLLRRNMRREYLTEEELLSALRQKGLEDISRVRSARVESEGRISVVPL